MPIKLTANKTLSEVPVKMDDWSGPWGRISPTPRSADTLQISKGAPSEEIHYYPYRVLSSWHFRDLGHGEDELRIEAGPDLITIVGRGLSRIATALNRGSLEILSESKTNPGIAEDCNILVSRIFLERARK